MAATRKLGNGTVFGFDTLGGASFNDLALQVSGSLTINNDVVPVTDKDSSQWVRNLAGNRSWSASLTANLDSQAGGDTDGQRLLRTAALTRALVDFQLTEDGTALTYTGDAIVSSVGTTYEQNGAQVISFELVGDGELAEA